MMKNLAITSFTCIAILLMSCNGGEKPRESIIKKVYEAEEGHAILFDTPSRTGNVVVSDEGSQFWLLSNTDDNNWIIISRAPSEVGEGRVETEQMLFYLPELRHVDFSNLNPPLNVFEMSFENVDGEETLIVVTGGDNESIGIPLAGLLRGELPGNISEGEPNPDHDSSLNVADVTGEEILPIADGGEVVIELTLGTGDDEIGQGTVDKQIEGGRYIYAIPSFATGASSLYIIDAINFRILVSDYNGTIIRKISYPESLPGRGIIVARDIALDNEYVYLLSSYENAIYVIDKETEDIATIIEGPGTAGKKFGDLRSVQTDHGGNILLFDANDNMLYSFSRDNASFTLIKTTPYKQPGELVPAVEGKIYTAKPDGNGFTLSDEGNSIVVTVANEHRVGSAEVLATDVAGNIYVKVTEEEQGAQFRGSVSVRVVSPEGQLIRSANVGLWPNGPMERNLVIDKSGILFESTFDGMPDNEEWPATKLIIKRYW